MIGEAAVLWLAFLLAAEPETRAQIADLRVALEGRRVKVSFRLESAFKDQLVERIESGLPTGFVYEIALFRDHKRWFDRKLDEAELQVAAMYNAVTHEYLVNYKQDGKLTETRVVRDLAELEQAMTRFQEVPAFTVGETPQKWRLLVKARADLGRRNLLSLFPTRITTDWAESRKFRLP